MPKITRNPRRVRLASGTNQDEFWKRIRVTQSGGSRYESGRKMPPAVQALFVLAYGKPDEAAHVVNSVRGIALSAAAFTTPQPKVRRTAAA